MQLVKVPEAREVEFLQMFAEKSMLTFEGVDISDKSHLKELEKFFKQAGYEKRELTAYYIKGSVMNKHFNLTDHNAYSDDLNIVVIPDFHNSVIKVSMGLEWFDDLVAINMLNQHSINEQKVNEHK